MEEEIKDKEEIGRNRWIQEWNQRPQEADRGKEKEAEDDESGEVDVSNEENRIKRLKVW